LAKTWGPSLPVGSEFQVEKIYGRWLYGTPRPLKNMKPGDYAKPGWVYSRMLIVPGDVDSTSKVVVDRSHAILYHSQDAWKKLKLDNKPGMDLLESLVLSRATLTAFQRQDETASSPSWLPSQFHFFSLLSNAEAAETNEAKDAAPLGLTGTNLTFLDQEFAVAKKEKQQHEKSRLAKLLRPPPVPKLDLGVRTGILGRFMLQKYFELPALSQEEVDGQIYMRATATRALEGCPKKIRDFWKNRRWNMFRIFRLKSRPEIKHPWLDLSLPGGYFTMSARAIDLASNEAELAYLLIRPLVLEARLKRPAVKLSAKGWPESLQAQSELVWDRTLRAQSTRDSENLDVADDIAVDLSALECVSRAGYRPAAGLNYLRKLSSHREDSWAKWFVDHSIGLDYRLEQVTSQLDSALAQQKFPGGQITNTKRFGLASSRWNLMP
jgi:hypothetical protein